MKTKISIIIITCSVLLAVFSGCKKDKDYNEPIITMTTAAPYVSISLEGSGEIIIDWGDNENDTYTLTSYGMSYSHSYSDSSEHTINITGNYAISTMYCYNKQLISLDVSNNAVLQNLQCYNSQLKKLNVSGCTALKYLYCENNQLTSLNVSTNTALNQLKCYGNQLTSLDVSKNTALNWLACHNNQLTSLDVSNNKVLYQLSCDNNQLDANALNALFGTLHSAAGYKQIFISNNPGTNNCDQSIATNKGWEVW